ncbi:MAG: hypothetical protein M0009_03690 [Deltaproteobacteria bacterium]|nr:hypothetical protein [Deltaproteobacteria bacterium]
MTLTSLVIAAAVIVALILLFSAFARGRYGKLRASGDAARAYESFVVDPERQYYSSGPDDYPNALLGLDKTWTLDSDLWRKRDVNGEGMQALVKNMQARAWENAVLLHGFAVLDDREQSIGDWYSLLGLRIMIKITGEKRVAISTPPIDTYAMK